MPTNDAVVVGAGPAGCSAAARLLASGRRVTLLEAGPGPDVPPEVSSLDALAAVDAPGWVWPSVRWGTDEPGLGGPYALGRGTGGGAAVNSMVLTVGDRSDYDEWARRTGDGGWSWAIIEDAFDEISRRLPTTQVEAGPLGAAVAAASQGVATADPLPASMAPDGRGAMAATVATEGAHRVSLVDAMLRVEPDGALHPDLDLRAGRSVRRVIAGVDGAVVGVETDDGTRVTAPLVVLCAGALHTPALAETGRPARWVGPGGDDGVRPVMDHPSFAFTVVLRADARVDLAPRPPVSVVVRSALDPTSDGDRAELLVHVLDHVGPGPDGRRHGAVVVALANPRSVGSIHEGPDDGLVIRPGWLVDDADRRGMVAAVRRTASWLRGVEVDAVAEAVSIDDQGTDIAAIDNWSDDELGRWLVDHPGPVRHPSATMSPLLTAGGPGNPGSVEEGSYVRGLVAADGSVLPTVPSVNPQLPIMINAWRLMGDLD